MALRLHESVGPRYSSGQKTLGTQVLERRDRQNDGRGLQASGDDVLFDTCMRVCSVSSPGLQDALGNASKSSSNSFKLFFFFLNKTYTLS